MIDTLESLSIATAGPAPGGDIVATVYKDSSGSALYVEPLLPQSLTCLGPVPVGAVSSPVDRNLLFLSVSSLGGLGATF
jgi:hypothetical protein